MRTTNLCLSSEYLSAGDVIGTYTLDHDSDIGVKYKSINGTKITYSSKITNFLGGSWRVAKDSSPYTLYYANPSRSDSIPLTGWRNIDMVSFTGTVQTNPCSGASVPVESMTPSVTPSVTPSITPSVTPSATIPYVGLNHTHNKYTETCKVFARATVNHVSHLNLKTGKDYAVLLTGYSLNYTTAVYLSSNNDAYDMEFHDPVQSSEYPPFSGMKINFSNISENELIVSIPKSNIPTTLDLIIVNPAGYGKLTPEYQPISTEWLEYNLQHSDIDITE